MGDQQQQILQNKRRRVTRACDECRKKKVKCDGQQPCIHCTVYSYECTYNQPTKRSNISASTQSPQSANQQRPHGPSNGSGSSLNIPVSSTTTTTAGAIKKPYGKDSKMQSQLMKYKQLFHDILPNLPDIDSLDVPTFTQIYRNFSANPQYASSILSDTVTEYNLIAGDTTPRSSMATSPDGSLGSAHTEAVESIDGSIQSQMGREIKIILPPKPIALQFLKNVWEHCCVLLRFYHRPSFIKQFDELYETDPQNYTHNQMQFLPLCYSTMAVGALFSKSMDVNKTQDNQGKNESNKGEDAAARDKFLEDEGYKYFIAARKLIDITNARDLNSIQTILMLFIFLQCSARLSTCYAYIGVAMRSALREGLHRSVSPDSGFSPIEIEMRKRLFYTIYKLDVYVNAMLGLPRSISSNDFDQTLPIELSDENITEEGYFPENQKGKLSSAEIANQHTKLIMILNVIVGELYPIRKTNNLIRHEVVTELELKLRQWLDGLPRELIPGIKDVPKEYETANKLLHLSFFHVQLILYRPFIHYLSRNIVANSPDSLSIQRARNSVDVARAAVNLAEDMLRQNLLTGSYWYGSYTIFYSVAGLLFYIHEARPTDKASTTEYEAILKDAEVGRNVLLQLKDSSMAADRTFNLLNKLFEKLNSKTIRLSAIHGKAADRTVQGRQVQQDLQQPITVAPQQIVDPYNTEPYYGPDLPGYLQSKNTQSPSETSEDAANKSTKTISGVNTINTAATSNLSGNENDIFLKSDTTPLDGLFMFDGLNPEIFGGVNMPDNSFKGYDQLSMPGEPAPSTTTTKGKNEPLESESYVPGVFDQLDVQLFGRFLPPYMSQPNGDQQATMQKNAKQ